MTTERSARAPAAPVRSQGGMGAWVGSHKALAAGGLGLLGVGVVLVLRQRSAASSGSSGTAGGGAGGTTTGPAVFMVANPDMSSNGWYQGTLASDNNVNSTTTTTGQTGGTVSSPPPTTTTSSPPPTTTTSPPPSSGFGIPPVHTNTSGLFQWLNNARNPPKPSIPGITTPTATIPSLGSGSSGAVEFPRSQPVV